MDDPRRLRDALATAIGGHVTSRVKRKENKSGYFYRGYRGIKIVAGLCVLKYIRYAGN